MPGPGRDASLVGQATERVAGSRATAKWPDRKGATMMLWTEPRETVGPQERRGVVPITGRADTSDTGNPATASRLLADRLVAGLDDRPFCPTPDQLAWIWGGDLVRGETRASRARIAAGRYAALFTDHVIGDISGVAAPGAYARIWLSARLAFIESTTSEPSEPASRGALRAWESEGGARA